MNAVARVWWTFFTALPLQRWLGGSGVFLAGLLAIPALGRREPLFWMLGALAIFILVVFPALFASAAVFRALSAPHATRLLPRFRVRMLAAVVSLMASGILFFAVLLFALASLGGRVMPLEPLVYAFAFVTATFMLMFLVFGDWRWMWVWIGAAVGLSVLGLSARPALAAVPTWAWLIGALASWGGFSVWYVLARRIGPLALVQQPHADAWSRADLEVSFTRESALRALVTARPPRSGKRVRMPWAVIGIALATVIAVSLTSAARFFPFTSFLWPFAMMIGAWSKATSIVHRSRLLWLRLPGSRDAVRREVERALLRNFAGTALLLLGVAALYGSPLVATPPRDVLAGFVLAACAGLLGTYAAFAATPGNVVQLVFVALWMVAQIALLSRPSPAPVDVIIVAAIELVAAIALRALAIARWRRVDWLLLRPLPQSNMLRNA